MGPAMALPMAMEAMAAVMNLSCMLAGLKCVKCVDVVADEDGRWPVGDRSDGAMS